MKETKNKEEANSQPPPPSVSIKKIYSICDGKDYTLMTFGMLGSLSAGAAMPLAMLFFGQATNAFAPSADIMDKIEPVSLKFTIIGCILFTIDWMLITCWSILGDRVSMKYREKYLKAVMQQEVGWFDKNKPQEISTRISTECVMLQNAFGSKVGSVIMGISMFIAGMIMAFLYGWQLALVLLAITPILGFAGFFLGKSLQKGTQTLLHLYSQAGGFAEEALANIKTVSAFGTEDTEHAKYISVLQRVKTGSTRSGFFSALTIGFFRICMWVVFALGYYFGMLFIEKQYVNPVFDKTYDAGTIMMILFNLIISFMSLGIIMPSLKIIGEGLAAGGQIYEIINRKPEMELSGRTKISVEDFKGEIKFTDVNFTYPTRPDLKVLNEFSAVFEAQKMTAICGESGSGKSTIVQLIERFYDINSGLISVDGVELKDLDLEWFREKVGFVGQEPVLFNTSILDNIKFGNQKATLEEIESACERAECLRFIKRLPDGLKTIVGPGGSKLSGGQKQRIAIARAILKNPRILLLDEATSALDRKNERKVQHALEGVAEGVTTIVIAHRLSTIINAHKIYVLQNGVFMGVGTHNELLTDCPYYKQLYQSQTDLHEGSPKVMVTDQVEDDVEDEIHLDVVGESPDPVSSTDMQKAKSEEIPLLLGPKAIDSPIDQKKQEELEAKAGISRLFKENIRRYGCIILGSGFSSAISSIIYPLMGIWLTKIVIGLLLHEEDKVNKYSLIMGLTGVGDGIFGFLIVWMFGVLGQAMATHVRAQLYQKMLYKHMGWLEEESNNSSRLCAILSEDAMIINGVIENILATYLQSFLGIISAIIIAYMYSWRMASSMLGIVPIIAIAAMLEQKGMGEMGALKKDQFNEASGLISEACQNFRTVSSFSGSTHLNKIHRGLLKSTEKPLQKKALCAGLSFAFSQGFMLWVDAFIFYIGALFIAHYNDDAEDIFMCIYVLMFGAIVGSQAKMYVPDWDKAKTALVKVYRVIDHVTQISPKQGGHQPKIEEFNPRIEFQGVWFKYPTRPNWVLQDFSLKIEPGKHIAIVGQSGSGKSTILQLLLRFYDVTKGSILLDGTDIKEYNLEFLRRQMGIVFQEPVLFDTTIGNNIKYGFEEASDPQIIAAAGIANAQNFIEENEAETLRGASDEKSLVQKEGYNRRVGNKGSLLSGGQKQRIAIARAIIRSPKILLLDEATSALDKASEEEVQIGLRQALKGRTSLVVAHRISTIEGCDFIYAMHMGKVIESGTYADLIREKGFFYNLAMGNEQINNLNKLLP